MNRGVCGVLVRHGSLRLLELAQLISKEYFEEDGDRSEQKRKFCRKRLCGNPEGSEAKSEQKSE